MLPARRTGSKLSITKSKSSTQVDWIGWWKKFMRQTCAPIALLLLQAFVVCTVLFPNTQNIAAQPLPDGPDSNPNPSFNFDVTEPDLDTSTPQVNPAGGAHYVALAGHDGNDGSFEHPWKTIQRAANSAVPGDNIYVHAGTYHPANGSDSVVQVTASGTHQNPIVFQPYNGERVIIDATIDGLRRNWGFYVNQADHISIRGFEIRGAKRAGIRITGGDQCVVSDCTVYDIRDTSSVNIVVGGIVMMNGYSAGGIITRNEVYDCSQGIIVRNEGGQPIEDVLVERNYVHDIHWWNATLAYNNKNADGIVLNTTLRCILRRNVIARCGDDGVDCYNSNEAQIVYNTVFNHGDVLSNAPAGSDGDGNGIKVSTGGGGGHLVARNIVFNCERAGYDQDHVDTTAPGNTFQHNISYGNGRNGWIIERLSSSPTVLNNNIAFANDQDNAGYRDIRVVSPAPIQSDFNFWSDGLFPSGEGSNSLSGNPLLAAPFDPGTQVDPVQIGIDLDRFDSQFGRVPGLSPDADSPCVDAGMDLDAPYFGDAPDMGPYEMRVNS